MANVLTAGNSSNGGTAISTDTSGTLNIVTGSGSGSNAITIDASQAVTMPGNLTVSGTLTASGGVSGGIRSGTAVTASGTSVDFTSLPAGIKRITVMFSGVSTSGTSAILVQLGDSGGVENTSYTSGAGGVANSAATSFVTSTAGFLVTVGIAAANTSSGVITICTLGSNIWTYNSILASTSSINNICGGIKTLSDVLDRVRITTVNGTDTFDAGTINILWE